MGLIRKKRCRHCRTLFVPDPRNVNRQRFCGKPDCRRASKADSPRRWLRKPENQDYFRGQENVKRVQRWRRIIRTMPGVNPDGRQKRYKIP